MFSPSAKNWIAKYFTYVDSGEIVIADSTHIKGGSDEKNDEILHFFANHTGLTLDHQLGLFFLKR